MLGLNRKAWIVAALLVVVPIGCKAQKDAFYNQIFTCNSSATQDTCGTTRDGKPMTCFVGSSLGGEDFCVEACDPARSLDAADPEFTCVASGSTGALLRICHPLASAQDPSLGCPAPLQCYRTDLIADEGVCLDMRVCATNADCGGGTKSTLCAGTILSQLLPMSLAALDHLQCVQPTCTSGGANCPPGQLCLADYYESGSVPDICVPACDSSLHCPPNFSCATATSGAGSPAICIPGVPGARCVSDQDCVAGACLQTGAGFGECTLPATCTSASDCAGLSRPGFKFVCGESPAEGARRCIAINAFRGADCDDSSQCPQQPFAQMCYRYSPYLANMGHGECRIPCDANLQCPTIAGVAHTCLDDGGGGCYPGDFGLGCARETDCLSGLSCLPASPDARSRVTSPNICTIAGCGSDDDCRANPLIQADGFCLDGLCRLGGAVGDPCDRDNQCRANHLCVFDAAGLGTCSP